eukprot:GHVP01039433.1.p1 GENE.GHVP01039433.1~~GHVP01039433.1.p1  ORF type:complete len:181 (-),score=24.61 GHVP01039433.1:756-1298(-)
MYSIPMTTTVKPTMKTIVITGTPGTGKTSICLKLKGMLKGMKHYEISSYIRDNNLYSERDTDFDSLLFDPDLLEESIKKDIIKDDNNINIIDFHCNDMFNELNILFVVVIKCKNDILYDRLNKRNYHENKIMENISCEIFNESFNEAIESYDENIVFQLDNNTYDDQAIICDFIKEKLGY